MVSSFKSAAKKVEKLKDELEEETEDAAESSMGDVRDQLRAQLRANGSVASGRLLGSLRVADRLTGAPGVGARIMGADYWRFLEFGTGTGRGYKAPSDPPPIGPIHRWVVAKGIVPDPFGPYDTQRELAQAIQHSLPTGTRSSPFVRPVWRGPMGKRHVIEEVGNGMERALHKTF